MTTTLGQFVWKISTCPADLVVQLCKQYGISAVTVKVQNGWYHYNTEVSEKTLQIWIQTLKDAGIEVHGWVYIYALPSGDPVKQAVITSERVKTLGLKSILLDIEEADGSGWKTSSYRKYSAQKYLDSLTTPAGYPIGLCSYRYPNAHPEVPWSTFLSHPRVTHVTPQVYWMQAHNPGAQLISSMAQYRNQTQKPYVPVGAMFSEYGWAPTAEEVRQFALTASPYTPMVWFWTLDDVVRFQHYDWLEAAAKAINYIPPVVVPVPTGIMLPYVVNSSMGVNVRSQPSTSGTVMGTLKSGTSLSLLSTGFEGQDVWVTIADGPYKGKFVCMKTGSSKLLVPG